MRPASPSPDDIDEITLRGIEEARAGLTKPLPRGSLPDPTEEQIAAIERGEDVDL